MATALPIDPDTLNHGPDLDRMVSTLVMQWHLDPVHDFRWVIPAGRLWPVHAQDWYDGCGLYDVKFWRPSYFQDQCALVLRQLLEDGHRVAMWQRPTASYPEPGWRDWDIACVAECDGILASAHSQPLALCRAALKAVAGG